MDNSVYILQYSYKPDKKYMVTIFNLKTQKTKTIHFGAKNYEDFTIHKDLHRLQLYDLRHKKREDWNNPMTAGFWSKWLLWNQHADTIDKAIRQIQNTFNIKIIDLRNFF